MPDNPLQVFRNACEEASNRFRYVKDTRFSPGNIVPDLWQTPYDTEEREEGDCEDFNIWAIARTIQICNILQAGTPAMMVVAGLMYPAEDRSKPLLEQRWHVWSRMVWGDLIILSDATGVLNAPQDYHHVPMFCEEGFSTYEAKKGYPYTRNGFTGEEFDFTLNEE